MNNDLDQEILRNRIRVGINYEIASDLKQRSSTIPRTSNMFLQPGWIVKVLIQLETNIWGRWQYRDLLDKAFFENIETKIPKIKFDENTPFSKNTTRLVNDCLNLIPENGEWDQDANGWIYLEYLCDYLLFGFGHPSHFNEPIEPGSAFGARERLFCVVSTLVFAMIANPCDYFNILLAEAKFLSDEERKTFKDAISVAHHQWENFSDEAYNPAADESKKMRIPVPSLSSRAMLHASNHYINIWVQDTNPTLLKMYQVYCYMYAPWVIEPLTATDLHSDFYDSVVNDADVYEPIERVLLENSSKIPDKTVITEAFTLYAEMCEIMDVYTSDEHKKLILGDDLIMNHDPFYWRYIPFIKRAVEIDPWSIPLTVLNVSDEE